MSLGTGDVHSCGTPLLQVEKADSGGCDGAGMSATGTAGTTAGMFESAVQSLRVISASQGAGSPVAEAWVCKGHCLLHISHF